MQTQNDQVMQLEQLLKLEQQEREAKGQRLQAMRQRYQRLHAQAQELDKELQELLKQEKVEPQNEGLKEQVGLRFYPQTNELSDFVVYALCKV